MITVGDLQPGDLLLYQDRYYLCLRFDLFSPWENEIRVTVFSLAKAAVTTFTINPPDRPMKDIMTTVFRNGQEIA